MLLKENKIKRHYIWQHQLTLFVLLGLVCVALLRESIVADPIASNDEEEWEFNRAKCEACLFWLFCGFLECEQLVSFFGKSYFVSSCFHALLAHRGLFRSNCCFSSRVGKSLSPPYCVSRGIIQLILNNFDVRHRCGIGACIIVKSHLKNIHHHKNFW